VGSVVDQVQYDMIWYVEGDTRSGLSPDPMGRAYEVVDLSQDQWRTIAWWGGSQGGGREE
jgi:hypothetical protein